ncbi:CvpA family protein [Lysobacter sp. F6437]|uniref:CvpA family protein n=1 Tax=Lysobacter sp. F6437 TaxID=3459296 RepID=UPI00403DBFE2
MSAVDWVLLAIVGVSALLGLMRGFVGVLASLAAWVLAGWAAFRFGAQVALMLASDGEPGPGQLLAGYGLSFLVVLLAVGLVGWVVRKLVHSVGLSGLDRLLGLVLGFARGALVACLVVLLMGLTELPRTPEWRASAVVPVFVPGAQWMQGWLPEWVSARVDLRGESTTPALVSPGMVSPEMIRATRDVDLPMPVDLPLEAAAEVVRELSGSSPAPQQIQEPVQPQSRQQPPLQQPQPGS